MAKHTMKKANQSDLTLRNLRAKKKLDARTDRQINDLKIRVGRLEVFVDEFLSGGQITPKTRAVRGAVAR